MTFKVRGRNDRRRDPLRLGAEPGHAASTSCLVILAAFVPARSEHAALAHHAGPQLVRGTVGRFGGLDNSNKRV